MLGPLDFEEPNKFIPFLFGYSKLSGPKEKFSSN